MIDPHADHARKRLTTALIPVGLFLGAVWAVFLADHFGELRLYAYGIMPRSVIGLRGVLAAPFIHDHWEHLIGNSAPMAVLGWLLVYFYPKAAWRVVLACWLIGGLCVWAVARPNYHIGASGVIYGLASFLFFSGVIRRRAALIGVSFMVVFLYGSWVWGVLPLVEKISWEGHLAGGVVGGIMAWFFRAVPTAHVPSPVVLEDDDDAAEPGAPPQEDLPPVRRMHPPGPYFPPENTDIA